MKDIQKFLVEDQTGATWLPTWADYLCINIVEEEIEFYSSKRDKIINNDPNLKKMKYGDIYRDEDDLLWVCYKDTENILGQFK